MGFAIASNASKMAPVIIVDTFAAFSGCDENDNAAVGKVFKTLRAFTAMGATVMLIHHTAKSDSSDYRGASAMLGAIDVGLKIEATHEEETGKISRMAVKTFKTRLGDGKRITYKMVRGIPVRETVTSYDLLLDLLAANPGLSKDAFTELAMRNTYRRGTIRDFIDNSTVAGLVTYENRRLKINRKAPVTETTLFKDLEDDEQSAA